ncbi:MAG TPA: hypothetical protein VNP95_05020 [Thermomicrobiales bacterium]|nr:hypothetical protein [Thermomicrobiales bacterium]
MLLAKNTSDVLDDLISALIEDGDDGTDAGPTVSVPKNLVSLAAEHGLDDGTLQIQGKRASRLYREARILLAEEESLEHLPVREREALCSDIVWRTYIAQQTVQLNKVVRTVKRAFVAEHVPPKTNHRVFYEVRGLSLDRVLTINGVNLECFTKDQRELLVHDLGEDARSVLDAIPDGSTLASVTVKANSFVQAKRLGEYAIDDALSMLRCSALQFRFRIIDEQLLFARGAETLIERNGKLWDHWERPRQQLGIEVVGQFRDYVDGELEWMSEVNAYQGRLRNQLIRAMHWVGSSVQRETFDDKITDLCTAIECLLTTRQDGRKAEPICVRYMALSILAGEGCYHLDEIYGLYDKRSRVVHGSARLIGDEKGYRKLQTVAIDILQQVLKVLKDDGTITNHAELLRALDNQDLRERCLAWCERESGRIPMEVVAYLREALGKGRDESVDRSMFPANLQP